MSGLMPYLVIGVALVSLQFFGARTTVMFVALVGIGVFPRNSVELPLLGTFMPLADFAICVCVVIALIARPRLPVPAAYLPFVAYVFVMWAFGWSVLPVPASALTLLLTAVLAWFIGGFVGGTDSKHLHIDRWILIAVAGVLLFQTFIAFGQSIGMDWFPAITEASQLEASSRSAGTFGHPGNLGKVLILLMSMILPMITSPARWARRSTVSAMLLGTAAIGLSGSRTNFIAVLILLVIFMLLQRGTSRKVLFALLVAIVAGLSLNSIIERFQNDPLGGERGHLMEVALENIPQNLWFGVGPGNYIEYFGQFDALTSRGWPVHNAFVYIVAELGLIGAFLLFCPMLLLAGRSFVAWSRGAHTAQFALSYLSATVAILAMGLTGWGLASGFVLYAWFFAFGFLEARLRAASPSSAPAQVATRLERRLHRRR